MDHECQQSVPQERPEESCSLQDAQDPQVGQLLRNTDMLPTEGNLGEPEKIKMPKMTAGISASLNWSPAVERSDREPRFTVKCSFPQIVQ